MLRWCLLQNCTFLLMRRRRHYVSLYTLVLLMHTLGRHSFGSGTAWGAMHWPFDWIDISSSLVGCGSHWWSCVLDLVNLELTHHFPHGLFFMLCALFVHCNSVCLYFTSWHFSSLLKLNCSSSALFVAVMCVVGQDPCLGPNLCWNPPPLAPKLFDPHRSKGFIVLVIFLGIWLLTYIQTSGSRLPKSSWCVCASF